MKRLFLVLTTSLLVSCLTAQDWTALFKVSDDKILNPVYSGIVPVCSCEDLKKLSLPNTTIESALFRADDNSCRVTAVVNHPPSNDRVTVYIALPLKKWNGRFYGMGGGGFMAGIPLFLNLPVSQGFASAVTDAGHSGGSGSFALDTANHRLRWQEIRDFAYQGIHDMTVTGKEVIKAFYGKPAGFSYFVGGSTGGRQGMMEAQRFPGDYDGIISYYPAINWSRLLVADLWPQVVMNDEGNYVSKAKLEAVTRAVIEASDGNDNVIDGVIDDPISSKWDPGEFTGTAIGDEVFTSADATVVNRIWEGPRTHDGKFMWYGPTRGARLTDLAGTKGKPLIGVPFDVSLDWIRYFLLLDPHYDVKSLTWAEFELLFNQSVDQFTEVIGTENPDLTGFKGHGGKLIIIHGLADQLVPPQGTIDYFGKVQDRMGGRKETSKFVRLFLVPGTDHSLNGAGPSPVGNLDALIRWVEEGKAPEYLNTMKNNNPGKIVKPYQH
ncbi:MAG: tannase/feruloyl esterase family alpha/beta hydrolase [Bacteroidota bacterium]